MQIAASCYFYFVAKLTELLDTVFFVLRKKERQVSFLHLYHHTVMPIISWGCVKFMAGGHGTFIGFINCFVHIVMYTYYLLAAAGFTNLWWKKYVTRLQLVSDLAKAFDSSPPSHSHHDQAPSLSLLSEPSFRLSCLRFA